MYIIQNKLKEYIKLRSVRKFQEETWIGSWTIYSIMNWHKNKKYTKQTLDTLYDYFHLKIDVFYNENIKINSWQYNPLWVLFRERREELGYKIEEVAKVIKWSDRHLRRIESWDSTFRINSYYIKELVKLYQFNWEETNQIMFYITSLTDIINLSKKRDVLD